MDYNRTPETADALSVLKDLGIDVDPEAFWRDGVCVVRGFATADECDGMRSSMAELIDAWDPSSTAVFSTGKKQISSDYFLDSASRIHFFLEKDAADADGKLREGIDKAEAINKSGHGLHLADPTFRKYAQSKKVAALARALGWIDPVLPQSMYIFKQPRIGGEVTSHQDSTFLFTEPRQSCLGLWLSLEEATEENGCVWGRPGSHVEPIRRRFRRNPHWFEKGDTSAPQMVFDEFHRLSESPAPWEGSMPPGQDQHKAVKDVGFVPLPCAKGDLVLIHGAVDHLSLPNTSDKSRHTFQLHLVEGPKAGVEWAATNWLQYPQDLEFPRLDLKVESQPD